MRAIGSKRSVLACAVTTMLEQLEGRRLLTAGDLDLTFGTGGRVTTDLNAPPGGSDIARAVVVMQADGKIVVAGESSSPAGTRFALARYNANGSLDFTFGGGDGMVIVDFPGIAGGDIARAMAIQADGKIVVAGQAAESAALGGINFAVARLNSDGTLDAMFGGGDGMVTTDFQGTLDSASALAIQADGRIVVAGSTEQGVANGGLNVSLARYNPDGSLDGTFDGDGRVVTRLSDGADNISALAIQPDGKIVAAGTATEAAEFGAANFAVVRYDATGALDLSFGGADGFVTTDFDGIEQPDLASDVAILPDGRILVAGQAQENVGGRNFALAMYLADGTLDVSFGGGDGKASADFVGAIDRGFGLVVQADGKFVVGGEVQEPAAGGSNFGLARFNADGSIDATFGGGDGRVTNNVPGTDRINDLFLQADGKIVAAGEANVGGAGINFALARYLPDTPPVARAGGPYAVDEGGSVQLDGRESNDSDQESSTLVYAWDLDGDGIFGETGEGAARGNEAGAQPVFSALGLDGGEGAGFNVRLRVTDRDGLIDEDSALIAIRNVAPVIASVTSPPAVDEGTPFTISISAGDAGGAQDVLTYHFDFDNDGMYEISSATGSASHTYADNGTYLVGVKVTDGDGGEATGSATVQVNNVAPTLTVVNSGPVSEGTAVTVTATASDPAGSADVLTYHFDFDNDGVYEISGPSASASHVYRENGLYDVNVKVTDGDGGEAAGTTSVTVNNVAPTAAITGAPAVKPLAGTPITLGSAVSDANPADTFTYAWTVTKDGEAVASGTQSTITFTPAEAGAYEVTLVVSDDDGGTSTPQVVTVEVIASSISGIVFVDANNNGQVDLGDAGIANVTVHLTGTDDLGKPVSRTTMTDVDGAYFFANLRPGVYSVSEEQPAGYLDGKEAIGSAGGTIAPDGFTGIALGEKQDGFNYNFGELQETAAPVHSGQTATIGFWQNKHGQALIKSLNGGATATALGHWLAESYPNMFGASSGANNLAGRTNAEVAEFYRQTFKLKGFKLDAQVLAVALAVYVTDINLAGTAATSYGFVVDEVGLGGAMYNVRFSGSAFGVANNTMMRVSQILEATDARAVDGVLYDGDLVKRLLALIVFAGINYTGHI